MITCSANPTNPVVPYYRPCGNQIGTLLVASMFIISSSSQALGQSLAWDRGARMQKDGYILGCSQRSALYLHLAFSLEWIYPFQTVVWTWVQFWRVRFGTSLPRAHLTLGIARSLVWDPMSTVGPGCTTGCVSGELLLIGYIHNRGKLLKSHLDAIRGSDDFWCQKKPSKKCSFFVTDK